MTIRYPATRAEPTAEVHFGQTVLDPFRWLEADVRQDEAVRAWVDAQNRLTDEVNAALPARSRFEERLRALWDYERFGLPRKAGRRYFYTRNDGLQNQAPLWVQSGLAGEPRLLIDPNGWAADGATALAGWEPSRDGAYLAYAVQDGGTDWHTLKVVEVETGTVLADEVRWVKFSGIAWARNGAGFFYSRFPEPQAGEEYQSVNLNHSIWFHRLGTPQSADRSVFATPDRPKLLHGAEITTDGRWMVVTSQEGTDQRQEVTLIDLTSPKAARRTLVRGLEHGWSLAGGIGDRLFFVTDKDAPRGRVVAIDVDSGMRRTVEIAPETDAVLQGASLIGDRLVLSYLDDVKSVVRLLTPDGRPAGTVPLPGIGTAAGFMGEEGDPETFFAFYSFAQPTTIYRFDTETNEATPFREPQVSFDPGAYEVEQRFFISRDGTQVPMFVVGRADRDRLKPGPLLLYGYGGFQISLQPFYSPAYVGWLEAGGMLAVANIRGGGEYGKAWHDGGRLASKQNSFDDFIAAAEHLISIAYTTPEMLAIQGGSNGGLLVGAVVNQRPDLFACALPAVGVMDMLRFHRFTAGRYWIDDYGNPDEEADFHRLLGFSPYHNVRAEGRYPAVLVSTADTDDRVVPGHSFKYAAALQAADLGDRPRLIRIETRAGHGAGKPTEKLIAEHAELWAFAAHWTGLQLRD
jgi:prolyl oligopeptidase